MKITKKQKKMYSLFAKKILAIVFLVGIVLTVQAIGPPYDVTWQIGDFYSETYSIEDLTFVWSGETGTASNLEISGGINNGSLSTQYNDAGTFTVQVYGKNNSDVQVTNTVSCSADVGCVCPSGYVCDAGDCKLALGASCAAYSSPGDTTPNLYFGPGDTVYWKPTVTGGDDPYTYNWTGDANGTSEVSGPFIVGPGQDYTATSGYNGGPIHTAYVSVTDDDGFNVDAACSISIRECNDDSDCINGDICRTHNYTCGPPLPVIIEPISLNPSVVNEGQQCNLDWEVGDAFVCELYRNGTLFDANAPTSTNGGGYEDGVDPGSYLLHCENEIGESLDAGPARCLLNPEIKET